jgi:hypothetical protein
MLGSQPGLADVKGPLQQRAGAVQVALVAQDAGDVVEAVGSIRVVGSQAGLEDGQGTLEQRAGAVEVALGVQDAGEAVEAVGGRGARLRRSRVRSD